VSDLRKKIIDAITVGDEVQITPLYETVDMIKKFFIKKHNANLVSEYEELVVELSEINSSFFWDKCYPNLIKKLLNKYDKEELLKIEKNLVNKVFVDKQLDEKIIIDFIGKIGLSELKVQEEGHIFLTNLGIFWIHHKSKVGNAGALYAAGAYKSLPLALMATRLEKKIIEKRDEFMTALEFHDEDGTFSRSYGKKEYRKGVSPLALIPKIPFTVPYNIIISNKLSFLMNFPYKENSEDKICKITFIVDLDKNRKESSKDFIQRKQEAFSRIRSFFLTDLVSE